MTKNEMLKILKDSFKNFQFFEEGHYYECKGQRVGMSVTRLIEQYANEFNAEEMAEKVANKENKLVEDVLAEWKYKADFACAKGSECHYYAQTLWNKEPWDMMKLGFDGSIEYDVATELIQTQAQNFYKDNQQHLEHLIDELPIGSEEYDIASCVDHLFYNKLTGGLVLVDYKTNSLMSGYNKKAYSKRMKIPLQHLNDDALHHYYIQLSIYKYLIEKYAGLEVEEMFIVYMSENIENYEIIDIGKSGSGKSASLRNFKKEEIAIANVLGKPLPFKSNLEAPKVDDYNIILKAIEKTDKKVIVIDDANYLITNEFMNKSSVKGFDKYNEMGNNFFNLINGIKNIEGGKTVYLIMHEDTDDEGNVKPKTIGKLLDDKVNIQGMFTICIRAMYDNGNYVFKLKTNGQDCVY